LICHFNFSNCNEVSNDEGAKIIKEDNRLMIEVEMRFRLPKDKRDCLLSNAIFVSKETFTDTYYELDDYSLSVQDIWLRTRNGKFMLKVPAIKSEFFDFNKNSPMYEFEDEGKIREILGIKLKSSLKADLESCGYKPLYTFVSTRCKYKKGRFSIDIDHVDYKLFTYDICEIESMVKSSDEIQKTLQELYSFAEKHEIIVKPIDGKLIYLIKRVNPEHYKMLQKVGNECPK